MTIQLREEVERAKVQKANAALPPPFALPFTAVRLALSLLLGPKAVRAYERVEVIRDQLDTVTAESDGPMAGTAIRCQLAHCCRQSLCVEGQGQSELVHSVGSPPKCLDKGLWLYGRGACADFTLQSAAVIKTNPTVWGFLLFLQVGRAGRAS